MPDPVAFDRAAGVVAPPANDNVPAAADPNAALPFDHWYKLAHGAFGVVSAVSKVKALAFAEGDAAAREAFKALYDTCSEIDALRFLIAPGSKWFQRAMAVGAFAVPMAMAVRIELGQRRAAAKASSPTAATAASPVLGGSVIPLHPHDVAQAQGLPA